LEVSSFSIFVGWLLIFVLLTNNCMYIAYVHAYITTPSIVFMTHHIPLKRFLIFFFKYWT
jgi:hypothetical protein